MAVQDEPLTFEEQTELDPELKGFARTKQIGDIQLIPASLFYMFYGGFGCYVKWKGHGRDTGTEIISISSWVMHLRMSDREIMLVGNLNKLNADISMEDWDEFIPFSLFHDAATSRGKGPSMYMVNAHQSKGFEKNCHRTREDRSRPHQRKQIMGDSGGFQLRTLEGFIDPVTVADFYNANVDIGVVLDYPLWDPTVWENLQGAAEIQRANTETMFLHLNPKVSLVNVAHGIDVKHRLDFLEIVHHPDIHRVAISKSYFGDGVVAFADGVYRFWQGVEERWPGHYTHLHILGMSENRMTLPIIRMHANGLLGNIKLTFDSASHILGAKIKNYFHHAHSFKNSESLQIGDDGSYYNPMQTLACSCPVCRTLGWLDAFTILSTKSINTFALMYHNIYAMDAYFKQLVWFAHHLDTENMTKWVTLNFKTNKAMAEEIRLAVLFVDLIKSKGYKKARKKFHYYIDYDTSVINAGRPTKGDQTLWGDMVTSEAQEDYYEGQQADKDWAGVDVPLPVHDAQRIQNYRQKIDTMRLTHMRRLEEGEEPRRKKKSKGPGGPKGKRKAHEEQKVQKKIMNATARKGPDLKKMKQGMKPTVKKSDVKRTAHGKTVNKTEGKNRARV